MYARPCSIKWRVQWRVQFNFSCKISVEFRASSFRESFGNVKIIPNNPNPTSSLWILPDKDVYFNVSIFTCLSPFSLSICTLFGYVFIKQLLDEVEHDIMNYHGKTEVCVICLSLRLRQITQTRGFDYSWYHEKTEFNNCFILHFSDN